MQSLQHSLLETVVRGRMFVVSRNYNSSAGFSVTSFRVTNALYSVTSYSTVEVAFSPAASNGPDSQLRYYEGNVCILFLNVQMQ